MKSNLTTILKLFPKRKFSQEEKFRLRYGDNWKQVAYCEMTPLQKEINNLKYLYQRITQDNETSIIPISVCSQQFQENYQLICGVQE